MNNTPRPPSRERLLHEQTELRVRLDEAEATLQAIRNGEVDAIVVSGPAGEQVYSLNSAEKPYRIIIEEMNEGAVTCAADDTVLYCNRKFAELVQEPLEKVIGSSLRRFLAAEELEGFEALFQNGHTARCSGVFASSVTRPDKPQYFQLAFTPLPAAEQGEVCIIATDVSVLKQKESELQAIHATLEQRITARTTELARLVEQEKKSRLALLNMMEDTLAAKESLEAANRKLHQEINDRRRAEAALRESEERFRGIFENATIGIYRTTPAGRILMANPRLVQILGYASFEELQERNLETTGFELDYPRSEFQRLIEKQGHLTGWESIWTKKDGTRIFVRESARALRDQDGNTLYYEGIIEDITEHKRLQRSLKEREQHYRTLVETAHEGILQTDRENRIVFANRAMGALLGCPVDDLLGSRLHQLYTRTEKLKTREKGSSNPSGELVRYTARLRTRRGGTKAVLVSEAPIVSDQLQRGQITVITDITRQAWAQARMRNALEKARRASAVKTMFLANMSHEIRTPLNALLGFTDLIEHSLRERLSPDEQSFFNIVRNSGERLMHSVHAILDISLIESGTYEFKRTKLNLVPLLEQILSNYQSQADLKEIELRLDCRVTQAWVHGDEYGLTQAITNLVDNALKYTEKGEVQVSLKRQASSIEVAVRDTGIGISREYQQHMFELFSQESEGYTKKYQGLGLGLSLAKRHLDQNQVGVVVTSRKGKGTTFTLTFPAAES